MFKRTFIMFGLMLTLNAYAGEVVFENSTLTMPSEIELNQSEINQAEPTVEDNIIAMDTDRNGMVTVEEMRIFVQSKHGSSYQSDTLKKMEAAANSRSCSSPFSRSFY